jgi:hypothetical protein
MPERDLITDHWMPQLSAAMFVKLEPEFALYMTDAELIQFLADREIERRRK